MTSLTLPVQPASHREVLAQLHRKYEQEIQNGHFRPFTYPMATYGAAVLLIYFLIPPESRYHALSGRLVAFVLIAAWHIFLIHSCRSHSMTLGFGVGIISAWGILWPAVLIVFQDAKSNFQRVKRVEDHPDYSEYPKDKIIYINGMVAKNAVLYQRKAPSAALTLGRRKVINTKNPPQVAYTWQPYPRESWGERLEWTIDLLTNFRGMGWNWSIEGLPSRPIGVQEALRGETKSPAPLRDKPVSHRGIQRLETCRALMLHNTWLFIKGYMAIDALKVLINRDPYFWGEIHCTPPKHLPLLIQQSPFLLRGYRLLVTMSMLWLGLRSIFCLGPFVFVGLAGPRYLGSNGEPWMYPDHYGSSHANISRRGLAGWWGGWWHQTFRYAFQAGGDWVSRLVNLDRPSMAEQLVKLVVAFSLSGILHASGSVTMLGRTEPWKPFLFFFVQPLGILVEVIWRKCLKRVGLLEIIPAWMGHMSNYGFAYTWLWTTGPLLADDLARGGLWLMEPIMFSPLRGMGLGGEGDGWYCWQGTLLTWHQDRRWWPLSGIAL